MKRWLIYGTLGCLTLVLLLSLSGQMRRSAAAEHTLREATLLALSEATEETQSMLLALDKLRITTGGGQATLTRQIWQHADRARHALAALPDEQGRLTPVLTWLGRIASLAEDDLSALAEGEHADPQDLTATRANLALLHTELDLARQEYLLGGLSAMPETALTDAPTAAEIVTYKGLPATEIGSGMALQLAKEFVGPERVLSVAAAPDTSGALPAYGVTVQTADVQLNLEVTSRGGKVLLMVPETADFHAVKTVDECKAAALSFLQNRGFAAMEATYAQVYDGLCVLTCVHVQEGVLVWPDRVLVQVRMDTAEVVGIEARSYWKNHTPRKIAAPLLTAEEARAALSPHVVETAARLCLLPSDGQERLCWQFTGTWMDDTYVTYVDAITGRELLLEKVMQTDVGSVAA